MRQMNRKTSCLQQLENQKLKTYEITFSLLITGSVDTVSATYLYVQIA